jgi:hypothetical protein
LKILAGYTRQKNNIYYDYGDRWRIS